MEILEDHSLKDFTSLRVGGNARYFGIIQSEKDIEAIHKFAKSKILPLLILGKGTNTIIKDSPLPRVVGLMEFTGINIKNDFEDSVYVEAYAGELWDDLVQWAVDHEYSGIEALSAIPGTVGAAPIQNIGAYGCELSDNLVNVKVYDTDLEEFVFLGLEECHFNYRDSIFKSNLEKYIVVSITLELSKNKPEIPQYKDTQLYFAGRKTRPSLKSIRKAIVEIRSKKLPDPSVVPNAGSFFKNPILEKEVVAELLRKYPEAPYFKVNDEQIKIYAGWLIEKIGLKGKTFGENVALHKNNSLVLITNGNATFKDIGKAKKEITELIKKKFDITLEMEPIVIK